MRPAYVERPGDHVWSPPFDHRDVRLRCHWLAADADRLASLCRTHFDVPSGGLVRVRPAGDGVALMFAHIATVTAPHVAPPTVTEERDAGFWMPVIVEQLGVAPRLAWFLPHLFVDEANALVIGREGSGFPKCLAESIQMPWSAGADDTARVTFRVRDAASREGRLAARPVITVAPSRKQDLGDVLGQVASTLPAVMARMAGGRLATLGLHFDNVAIRREVPLVLLRQLRSLDDPTRAALQEVVWLDNRITALRGARVLGRRYEVELADAIALPVAAALGLRPGRHVVEATVEADLDFTVIGHTALWSAASTVSVPPSFASTASGRTSSISVASAERTRVAILGGGIAGLATAWRLATSPGGQRFDITVYEKDHRLGGKCASGRDEDGAQRILEHGLHMWFGCYEETFRMLREICADAPGPSFRDLVEPQNVFEFWDRGATGSWRPWRLHFPSNALVPGDGGPLADAPALVRALGRWLSTALEMALVPLAKRTGPASAAATLAQNLLRTGMALLGHAMRSVASDRGEHRARRLTRALAALHARLRVAAEAWLARDEEARQLYVTVDLGLAALRGIFADRLLTRGFQRVDDEDFGAWLARHGAASRSVDAGPLRAMYDMAFAYRGGDRARPAFAAGTALHATLRILFAYSGAVAWKLRGSMGDVICGPMYEALARRGVRFEFFHALEVVKPDATGRAVDAVELRRTATTRGAPYDPFVVVDGARCWPERPRMEQLDPCDERVTLLRGRDFDAVVLAVPPAAAARAVAPLCAQRAAWRDMIASLGDVATAAAQLWFMKPVGTGGREGVVMAGFAGPWDTWADMTHTLASERWTGDHAARAVVYGCGPVTDAVASTTPDGRDALLAAYVRDHAATLWPELGAPSNAGEVVASRYARMNAQGSERYVQSLPGSTAARLAPDGSGYDNLWLAGDWTRTGFDVGCVEAAVCSGGIAARAIATCASRGLETTPKQGEPRRRPAEIRA
jgi:uncharacterized protein with NAD-binding domain and iron-sulfur cluster